MACFRFMNMVGGGVRVVNARGGRELQECATGRYEQDWLVGGHVLAHGLRRLCSLGRQVANVELYK